MGISQSMPESVLVEGFLCVCVCVCTRDIGVHFTLQFALLVLSVTVCDSSLLDLCGML